MRTIALVNQKGGCGKTTTAINLSACLSEGDRRVLLVDLDPQAHATLGLNVKPDEMDKSVYDVLVGSSGGQMNLEEIIHPISDHLDLAPSSVLLSAAEQELADVQGRERRLFDAFSAVSTRYDYAVVDSPPNLGLLTFNALRACQEAIVPVETSIFSLHGLSRLLEAINILEEKGRHKVKVWALATIFDQRTRLAHEILEEIRRHFQSSLLKTVIRVNVKLREAAGFGKPITDYDRGCTGYHDYAALAEEVVAMEEFLGPRVMDEGVVFVYQSPEAESVQVAADFNDWVPESMMDDDKDGIWEKLFPLQPGVYQYKFLVDGKWQDDPNNPQVAESPYGGMNSVVTVE